MTNTIDGPKGRALWRRYDKVIPGGGVYSTRSARFAGEGVLPGFVADAEGAYITDVDGRKYIDFNCGNGPNLLGYRHPGVDQAAAEQAARVDLAAFFPEIMPLYAEALLAHFADFDWVVFGKNGSDTTNLALRVMRVSTGRPLVVLFEAAYHGYGPALARAPDPVPGAAPQQVVRVAWNDVDAIDRVAKTEGERIAGIMVNPLDQSPGQPTSHLDPEMVAALHRMREQTGALITLDDVRHGFRLHAQGSHRRFGLLPDLLCMGKALANGYSTSALVGVESLRDAVERIPITATFMFSAVAFAAGLETLRIYQQGSVLEQLQSAGSKLVEGILGAARAHGHDDLTLSGPVTMPTLLFEGSSGEERARIFARQAAALGAIFHPRLNWFLCLAHGEKEIDASIEIAEQALALTPHAVA